MHDRHVTDLVPSPGGWDAPPAAMQPAPERMPWWVRIWYRIPLIARYAERWMWSHGGFLVLPPDHPFHRRYGPDEYEALTGVTKAEYERECLAFARDAFARDGTGFTDAEVALEGDGLDTEFVVRFRIDGRPERYGSRTRLWPSPHPDDYEGAPDWTELLPSLLRASIDSPYRSEGRADGDGVVWI